MLRGVRNILAYTLVAISTSALGANTGTLVVVVGPVELNSPATPVKTIQVVTDNDRVTLGAGARAVIFLFELRKQIEMRGAGTYRLTTNSMPSRILVVAEDGSPVPTVSDLPAPFGRIRVGGEVVQAGTVLRYQPEVRGKIGAPREKMPATGLRLRWHAADAATGYHLAIFGKNERIVYQAQTKQSEYTIPPSVRLDPGSSYTWSVEATYPNHQRAIVTGEFDVLTASEQQLIADLSPVDPADQIAWLRYALFLDSLLASTLADYAWGRAGINTPQAP